MAVVAGQIGSALFTVFETNPQGAGTELETLRRPGVDYVAYKEHGRIYREQELHTQFELTSHAAAVTQADAYAALEKTNQTIYRDATLYGTFKILSVECAPPRRTPIIVGGASGLSSGFVLRARWRIQRQS